MRRNGNCFEDTVAVAIVLLALIASWWVVYAGVKAAWRVLK